MSFGTSRTPRLMAAVAMVMVLALATGATRSYAILSGGTTFEGSDGDLIANHGGTDWGSLVDASGNPNGTGLPGSPLLHVGIDFLSGTSDNSFGQGTKEDSPAVTVVSGSIPPNKSDLTRFYEASDLINNQVYMYLAWERSNVLGSANMDFEINQNNPTTCPSAPGSCTINRSNGDILVTYDFTNGGSRPTVGILRWLTGGTAADPYTGGAETAAASSTSGGCFSSNTLPCWGDQKTISTTNSEGAVNAATVTDPVEPTAANTCPSGGCPAGTFGETAINLTGAGVINSTNACSFGGATTFLKSRSSASFTAEVKDFVAPVKTPIISQCGSITIIKHTNPRGLNQAFNYTSNLSPNASAGGVAGVDASGNFSLNDAGNTTSDSAANTVSESGLRSGQQYTVTEGADPTGFAFDSVSCAQTGTSVISTSGRQVTINLAADDSVTCTYVNNQQLGAIKITKTSSKGLHPGLQGARFSIAGPNGYSNTVTSGSDGTVCVDHLAFGTYSVQETAAPTGYAIDDNTAHNLQVNVNTACGSGSETAFAASDTPLTDLVVTATGEAAPAGTTKSQITCTDASTANVGNSPTANTDPATLTANGLKPGTYTCTVVIDP